MGANPNVTRSKPKRILMVVASPFAVRDGRLITGQQQYSGAATARLVIEALGV